MNTIDKISRNVLEIFNYSKDVIANNLMLANNSGNIRPKLTDDQISTLINIFNGSISQSYQKSILSFQKSLMNELKEENFTTQRKKK